jgi:hypothetical protein
MWSAAAEIVRSPASGPLGWQGTADGAGGMAVFSGFVNLPSRDRSRLALADTANLPDDFPGGVNSVATAVERPGWTCMPRSCLREWEVENSLCPGMWLAGNGLLHSGVLHGRRILTLAIPCPNVVKGRDGNVRNVNQRKRIPGSGPRLAESTEPRLQGRFEANYRYSKGMKAWAFVHLT